MSNTILFVFEGKKFEPQILENIKRNFFPENQNLIRAMFGAEIFQLWNIVKDDEYLNIVEILKERPNSGIDDLKTKDVSEVHLFFDHDAHSHSDTMSPREYQEKIGYLLDTFNDESSERGKLWISYPMAEAVKHCKRNPHECFFDAPMKIFENINYKKFVNEHSDFKYVRSFNTNDWHYLASINIQRTFCLVNDTYKVISDYADINHWFDENAVIVKQIHEKQYEKFIKTKNEVVAISPFPLFLLYYFGDPFFDKCTCPNWIKSCKFRCYQN